MARLRPSAAGRAALLLGLATLALGSCDSSTSPLPTTHRFLFSLRSASVAQDFVAETSDPTLIAAARRQLALPSARRNLFVSGEIARGNGGHNLDWSWHFVPDQWELVDAAIEVCDGTPEMVEEDLGYWIDTVGRFCPYSSYLRAEF